MAKTNKSDILKLIKSIEKKEGEGSIFHLGSKNQNLKIKRWSTNIEDFDHVLGGGMPEGRIVEVFGPESSGKTSLALHLAGLHDLALYIPTEGTFDAVNARSFGNRPGQLIVYRAKTGEAAMNKMVEFAQAGMPLIILDSVAYTIPKEDIDKTMKNVKRGNDNVKEERRIGGVARLMTEYLPLINQVVETTGTTVLLINQVRDKMNAMMFGEKTDTPGGRSLKHACSVRIQVNRKKWIEVPNKDPRTTEANRKIGLIMKGKTQKSKISNPFQEFEVPLIFGHGFVSFDDVAEIRKQIMKEDNERLSKGKSKKRYENDDE